MNPGYQLQTEERMQQVDCQIRRVTIVPEFTSFLAYGDEASDELLRLTDEVGNAAANPLIMRHRYDIAAEIIAPVRRRESSVETCVDQIVKRLSTGRLSCFYSIDQLSKQANSFTQDLRNDEFLRREEVEKRTLSNIRQIRDVLHPCIVKVATKHQLPRGLDQPFEYFTPTALSPAF